MGCVVNVELLWFDDCPNHEAAEALIREVLASEGMTGPVTRIKVPDEETGRAVVFPGSPTIRIDGRDVEPGWQPCEDCTPRCRLYATSDGLRGLPERQWVVDAVRAAASAR